MNFKSKFIPSAKKYLNTDLIFFLAIFLLPFENFFFAPSSGWAAISPLVLALYLFLNLKLTFHEFFRQRKIFFCFILAIIIASVTASFYQANIIDYFSSFIPLIIGAIELLAFGLFYRKHKNLHSVANILVITYSICAVIGIFQFLALKFDNISFINFFSNLAKRDYLGQGRVQFFFTEPSFIGLHLFGILLPIYWLTKRRDLLFVLGLISLEAVFFQSGIRVALDIIIVFSLCAFYFILKNHHAKWLPLILLTIILGFNYAYNSSNRIQKIIDGGVYSDGSLASRFFRIDASIEGYKKTFPKALLGFGLGNSIHPIHLGYHEAASRYTNDYTKEVEEYGNLTYHDDSASYSLYTRIISEYGITLFILSFIYLLYITHKSTFPAKWLYLSIILYLYLQFESWGFYALWLFILIMQNTTNNSLLSNDLKQYHKKHSNSSKSKILVFGITDKYGGVESVIMNNYRNFDKNKLQLDFLCNTKKVAYEEEIKSLGGKIYRISSRSKHPLKYYLALNNFFKQHASEYDAIWINVCSLANIDYLKLAKKYHIPRRIIHSHNSKNMDSKLRGIIHYLNSIEIDKYATDFWACSENAKKWFYNNLKHQKIKIIPNAIDLKKYQYNAHNRVIKRKELNIDDKIIITNIGRLNHQKNQFFILDLIKNFSNVLSQYLFIFVGVGEDTEKIKTYIKNYQLEKNVLLLGSRNDIPDILSASDLFLFPSVFEGSPVSVIEAEANGIPSLISQESYTEQRKLSNTVSILSLKENPEKWINIILKQTSEKLSDKNRLTNSNTNISYLSDNHLDIIESSHILQNYLLQKGQNA